MTWGARAPRLESVLRRSLTLGLVAWGTLTMCACSSGTETGNPSFEAALGYTAFSSEPAQVGLPASNADQVVSNAWLDLDAVALVVAGSCGASQPIAVSVPALGVGDHAAGKHNVTRFQLTGATYCELDLPFVQATAANADQPVELVDHSLFVRGALADGTPFSILSSATPTVHLSADAGSFSVTEDSPNVLIAFDFAAWLSGLDFASATPENGSIIVSAAQNPSLLARFESNLPLGVALYRDLDGDGKLDLAPVRLAHSP